MFGRDFWNGRPLTKSAEQNLKISSPYVGCNNLNVSSQAEDRVPGYGVPTSLMTNVKEHSVKQRRTHLHVMIVF